MAQDFECLLCHKKTAFNGRNTACVDHSHETGEVRGVLCHFCNLYLGYFEQSGITLDSLAKYLSPRGAKDSATLS